MRDEPPLAALFIFELQHQTLAPCPSHEHSHEHHALPSTNNTSNTPTRLLLTPSTRRLAFLQYSCSPSSSITRSRHTPWPWSVSPRLPLCSGHLHAQVPTAEQAALDGSRVPNGVFLRRVRCGLTDAVNDVDDYGQLDQLCNRGDLLGFSYDDLYDLCSALYVGKLAGTNRGVYAVYAAENDPNPPFTVNGQVKKNIYLYVHWMNENRTYSTPELHTHPHTGIMAALTLA